MKSRRERHFLAFEKEKVILPILLIFIFSLWIALDVSTQPTVKEAASKSSMLVLETLQLTVYNATLSGTNTELERELIMKQDASSKYQDYWQTLSLHASFETIFMVFGIPFCGSY